MPRFIFLLIACLPFFTNAGAQSSIYPDSVKYFQLHIEQQPVRMAYMDIKPTNTNGETVLLLHGKNFNGYYWKDVASFLSRNGYRVIVPDQVGWGKSDKPNLHYSFHLLAHNTKKLLDSLKVKEVHVVGHSMGGMLATRFALMYPGSVRKLVYENPIGLEDYKTFVPYQTIDQQYQKELAATYESYKKYQQTYYPVWKPEYEQYVVAQAEGLNEPDFPKTALVNAVTYQMIYEQPVLYEFKNLKAQTLIIIGREDRTVVGKNLLDPAVAKTYGQYPALGKWLNNQIKNSILVELKGVGHIPHIQVPDVFQKQLLGFLKGGR